MSIVDAIPSDWRLIIKQSSRHLHSQPLRDTFYFYIDKMEVDLLKITSKLLYTVFKTKRQTSLTAQNKIQNKYPELSVDWKKIYFLLLIVTIESKLREFQFKLLNDIVFTEREVIPF